MPDQTDERAKSSGCALVGVVSIPATDPPPLATQTAVRAELRERQDATRKRKAESVLDPDVVAKPKSNRRKRRLRQRLRKLRELIELEKLFRDRREEAHDKFTEY